MNNELVKENIDDEISLINILLFLKSSIYNIIISIFSCLAIGISYYFYVPNIYEATATIQMAQVAGSPVESPTVLLEKIKLPLYFSPNVWKACDTIENKNPSSKVAEKIKPVLNKSAPFITFTVQGKTTQEAKACLNAVIADIKIKQEEISKPILEQKKNQLKQLAEKIELTEEAAKIFPMYKLKESFPDAQFSSRSFFLGVALNNAKELKDLRHALNDIEVSLTEPQTKSTFSPVPMYAPEVATNKRPVFTLGICLMIGIFIGLLITGIIKVVPRLSQQLKDAKAIKPTNI
jgi:hypothetical protein